MTNDPDAVKDDTSTEDRIPPGWEKNPAAWSERLPIVGLALVGLGIAVYLSLYQWEVINRIWEPFFGGENNFGGGSKNILRESGVSKQTMKYLGVPDAFLGAFGYFVDAVTGAIGSTKRWKTMPVPPRVGAVERLDRAVRVDGAAATRCRNTVFYRRYLPSAAYRRSRFFARGPLSACSISNSTS